MSIFNAWKYKMKKPKNTKVKKPIEKPELTQEEQHAKAEEIFEKNKIRNFIASSKLDGIDLTETLAPKNEENEPKIKCATYRI